MTTNHFSFQIPSRTGLPPGLRADRWVEPAIPDPTHTKPWRYAPISVGLHAALFVGLVIGPLFFEVPSPEPRVGVRAFFAEPNVVVPPPPPPPPTAARPAAAVRRAPSLPDATKAFVAPTEISDRIARPTMTLDSSGAAGGVEGGVEGGVAGGIVGGLISEPVAPPKETRIVRVGGEIREPKRLVYVAPVYPDIAAQAGITGIVILEAHVGTDGRVKESTILRGQPLFDEPARAAVGQWRYQPLLLNGIPMEFVLTVTVNFNLRRPE